MFRRRNGARLSQKASIVVATDPTPATPKMPALAIGSDSGVSPSDSLTSIRSPTIIGTAEPNSLVTLYDADQKFALGTAIASATGAYSITSPLLADGAHSLFVTATGKAGDISKPSPSKTIVIDTSAPTAPTLAFIGISQTRDSASGPVIKLSTPTVTGFAEAGSTVVLYDGSTRIGSAVAGSAGSFTITATKLTEGVHKLAAIATDKAGNASVVSDVQTVTIDTKAPGTPAAPAIAAASDAGISSSDNLTNVALPTLMGNAEAGSTITLYDGTRIIATGTANTTTGAYTIVPIAALADGAHAFKVTATDAAGNSSAVSLSRQVTIDTKAPATPVAPTLTSGSDSGTSPSDGVTKGRTPTVTGIVEPYALVTLYDTDQRTVLGTATATAKGAYSITSAALADGAHNLQVKAADKAGNVSASSPGQIIIVDTSAPVAPAVSIPGASTTVAPSTAAGTDSTTTLPTGTLSLVGVNLSGGEYGSATGKYGWNYIYPSTSEIDYSASKNMNVIRLPFQWERVQPTLDGALSSAELSRIDAVVDYATSKGIKVVLDPHGFGAYNGQLIGSSAVPDSAFADFWGKVAAHFSANQSVMFGLMNEPNQQNATTWLSSENAAIGAIRAAGAKQEILVQGTYWDGASTWTTSDNAAVIGKGIKDPANNYAIELHEYLDTYASGTSPTVVSVDIGVQRLTAATQWAEANNVKLFLGEFGVGTDATSLAAMDKMLSYMGEHNEVWQGATYWAGGPWWGNYMYSIEPANGVDKPQMAILDQYAPGNQSVTSTVSLENVSKLAASANGTITRLATPTVIGTAEVGSTVSLYDGTKKVGSAVVGLAGTFTITSSKLVDGIHKLTATATDKAGNLSAASAVQTITIDTKAPVTPNAPSLAVSSDSGSSSSDGITNVTLPTLVGRAEAGSTITLYDGSKIVATATANASTGAYAISPVSALADGIHAMTVTATDAAGNASGASASRQIVIDTKTQVAISTSGGAVTTPAQSIAGTGEAGSKISLVDNGSYVATTLVGADGSWNAKLSLGQGTNSITAQQTDIAGNNSSSGPVNFDYNVTSLRLMVQAMSTLTSSSSSIMEPTAAQSPTDHQLAAAHG